MVRNPISIIVCAVLCGIGLCEALCSMEARESCCDSIATSGCCGAAESQNPATPAWAGCSCSQPANPAPVPPNASAPGNRDFATPAVAVFVSQHDLIALHEANAIGDAPPACATARERLAFHQRLNL
jgi:hypothetical protein